MPAYSAYARGTESLTFSWRRKTEDHHISLPLRMRGSLTELVSLGEDSTAMVAETEVQVTQGEARAVKIHLPASINININQVSGAAVADWEMQGGDLVVSFLEPVAQSTRFVVSGETRLARDGQVEIPLFRLLDAERETGGVDTGFLERRSTKKRITRESNHRKQREEKNSRGHVRSTSRRKSLRKARKQEQILHHRGRRDHGSGNKYYLCVFGDLCG